MNGDIERSLQHIRFEHCGERVPGVDAVLEALHEAEYGDHLFLRDHGETHDLPQFLIDQFTAARRR